MTLINAVEDVKDAFSDFQSRHNDQYKALQQQVDHVEAAFNRLNALGGLGLGLGNPGRDTEERKAFKAYLRDGERTHSDKLNALTKSNDPGAGYLAPPEMSAEFVRNLVEHSPIRSVASVRTTTQEAVRYTARTGITGAQWEGELEESQESSARFAMLEVVARKMSTYVDISNELLGDSGGQIEDEVRLAFTEDFGRKEASSFLLGDGVKQPTGLLNDPGVQSTDSGHATMITADALINLLYALPATYRNSSNFRWAMNGSTLAAIRKLKDGQGNYLWQPGLALGQPESLLGKPILEAIDMPEAIAGSTPLIAGDFSGYRIVDRLSLSVMSDPYTQLTRGVTRLHGTRRVGGFVIQPAKFRKLLVAA